MCWRFILMQVRCLANEFYQYLYDCYFGISLPLKWLNRIYSHWLRAFVDMNVNACAFCWVSFTLVRQCFIDKWKIWLDLFHSQLQYVCVYIFTIWIENPISTYIHIHFVFVCLFVHLLAFIYSMSSVITLQRIFHSREILCEWQKISCALDWEGREGEVTVLYDYFLTRARHETRRDVIFCISFKFKLWKFEWTKWKSAKNSDRKCSIFIVPFAFIIVQAIGIVVFVNGHARPTIKQMITAPLIMRLKESSLSFVRFADPF